MKISFFPRWADDVNDEHCGSIFCVHGGNFVDFLWHYHELYNDNRDDTMSNEGDDDDYMGRSSQYGDKNVIDVCLSLLRAKFNKFKAPMVAIIQLGHQLTIP